jgi:hypothetical protein
MNIMNIRQSHSVAGRIFTTDDTDFTDGKRGSSYPCHPCHPWLPFLGSDEPTRHDLSVFVFFVLFCGDNSLCCDRWPITQVVDFQDYFGYFRFFKTRSIHDSRFGAPGPNKSCRRKRRVLSCSWICQGPWSADLRTPPGQECSNGSLLRARRGSPGIPSGFLTTCRTKS